MANDEQTPDLSSLENDYQILTELHHSAGSVTYLARHLGLNRDVTITVVHAADAADHQMLTQLDEDTKITEGTKECDAGLAIASPAFRFERSWQP